MSKTMSHNVCYNSVTGRWLVGPRDVVMLDMTDWDGSSYPAFVTTVSVKGITVVRIKDCRSFTFVDLKCVNNYLRVTPHCKDILVRCDDSVFSVGESVIDASFDGDFEWTISTFDFVRSRAFLVCFISGRRIGHWADFSKLVKITKIN